MSEQEAPKKTGPVESASGRRPYEAPALSEEMVFERRALAHCAKEDPFSVACEGGPAEMS